MSEEKPEPEFKQFVYPPFGTTEEEKKARAELVASACTPKGVVQSSESGHNGRFTWYSATLNDPPADDDKDDDDTDTLDPSDDESDQPHIVG